VAEAGAPLGISRAYVYELVTSALLPSIKLGRLRRVRWDDLIHYVESLPLPDNPLDERGG
jgi:excisionase family DNA binding protein